MVGGTVDRGVGSRHCEKFPPDDLCGQGGERTSWYGVCVSHSVVFDSATPWTVAHQAFLSMDFSKQEYWSWLPFLSPGDLPDPGLNLDVLHCRQIL